MKKKNLKVILFLFIPLLVLLVISLMNMHKAGILLSVYKNYFFKQTLWFSLGFIILIIICIIYGGICIAWVLTHFPGIVGDQGHVCDLAQTFFN